MPAQFTKEDTIALGACHALGACIVNHGADGAAKAAVKAGQALADALEAAGVVVPSGQFRAKMAADMLAEMQAERARRTTEPEALTLDDDDPDVEVFDPCAMPDGTNDAPSTIPAPPPVEPEAPAGPGVQTEQPFSQAGATPDGGLAAQVVADPFPVAQ